MHERIESILRQHGGDPSRFEAAEDMPAVWTGTLPGARSADAWFALRDAFEETSLWPILRGEPSGREGFPAEPAVMLAAVKYRPLREILADRIEKQRSFARDVMGLEIPPDIDPAALGQMLDTAGAFAFIGSKPQIDSWPTQPPAHGNIEFATTRDVLSRKTHPVVELSLVGLKHPYEAPAYFSFGGWNDCPVPEVQVAVLRDWHDRVGAVPAAIAGDILECVVARPPMNEADSLELAADQWLFCDDIVSQGTMSFRRLAIELWRKPQWYFWWD